MTPDMLLHVYPTILYISSLCSQHNVVTCADPWDIVKLPITQCIWIQLKHYQKLWRSGEFVTTICRIVVVMWNVFFFVDASNQCVLTLKLWINSCVPYFDIVSINEKKYFSRAMLFLVETYLRRSSRTLSYHYCDRKSPILKPICNLFFSRVDAALIKLRIVFDTSNSLESKHLWSEHVHHCYRYRNPINSRRIWCILEWTERIYLINVRCIKTGRYRDARDP